MEKCYVESVLQSELEDKLDLVLSNTKTVRDRRSKSSYLKVGTGFDIETSRISVGEDLYSYCYHWQFGIGGTAFMGRSLSSMVYFMKVTKEYIHWNKPKSKLLVLDANLGYEWQFCKKYWIKMGISDLFAKEKRDPIYIEVAETFRFREVLGLFGHSLAEIAQNYCGMEKLIGDLDYSRIRLTSTPMSEKEVGYCVRDVEILVKLGEHIFDNYFGQKASMPLTSTGIVRAEIKKALGKGLKAERSRIKNLMPEEWEYELFRTKLFKGGICGSNILLMGKILDNVVGADITSDYPFQMLTKQFPVGGASRCESTEFMTEKIPYIGWVRFHEFRSRTPHALMSAHKLMNKEEIKKGKKELLLDNNRIQYAEVVELVINDVELNSLKKAYKWKHMEVLHCWKFKEGYAMLPLHIRKTVISWYLKKESLKAERSDTQEYRDAKAFVNSIFGMMCTALYLEDFELQDDGDIEGVKNKSYLECCEYLFLSPYWGFWITSWAREMLIDVITKFPRVIIQYDTDSVYFTDDGSDEARNLKKYLQDFNRITSIRNQVRFLKDPHMETIGTWSFDPMFKRFKALGSKRYMYEKQDGKIKCVVAGCRKSKKENSLGVSTIVLQNEFNNEQSGENVDVFDFFDDKMVIDKEHSEKMCSLYIDKPIRCKSTDYLGNTEEIEIPSCLVLKEIPFKMSFGKEHRTLYIAIKRAMQNSNDKEVYNIWQLLTKSLKSST